MRPTLLLLLALFSLTTACGGRSRSTPPPGARWEGGPGPVKDMGAPPPDRQPPVKLDRGQPPKKDQGQPPKKDQGQPPKKDQGPGVCSTSGRICGAGLAPCCGGLSCTQLFSGVSLCLRKCTPDNPSTPLINEDSCPNATTTKAQVCGDLHVGAGQRNFCLHRCDPALGLSSCPPGLACHPRSAVFSGNISLAVCIYPPCKSDIECPVYLSQTCIGAGDTKSCKAPGLPSSAVCGAPASSAAPGDPLHCVVPGVCDKKSGLCAPHKQGKAGAKVGDPCKDDRECGGQMRCDMQSTNSTGRVHARNGYCVIEGCSFSKTLTAFACPAGSVCHHLFYGGRCQRTCDLNQASSCRGHATDKLGDYECRAWNNLSIGGQPLVSTSICESGDSMPCNMLASSSLDCSSVGLQNNPTKMSCRNPANGQQLSNKYDPNGYCLDDTASGK